MRLKPNKVCFLKRHLQPAGGLEKYTRRLSSAFAMRGDHVHFISTDEAPAPFDTHLVADRGLFSYQRIRSFDKKAQKQINQGEFDIVFGMDRNSNQTHLRLGNGVHRAFLNHRALYDPVFKQLTKELNPLNRTILDIEKSGFENPALKRIFTNSHMVKDEVLSYYNVDPNKIEVIHNGVEWHELEESFDQWAEQKWTNAQNLKLDPHTHHLLFVGHGYKRKGLEPLLWALSLIRHLDFHLSIVGSDRTIDRFKQLAKSLGLENRTSFFGPQPSLTPFYQLADTVVIPSYYDPCANVTLEALAMGVFVLSSYTNGGHEVIASDCGLMFPSLDDIDSMAEVLMEALDHPKTSRSSKKIRDSVAHLDFKIQLEKYLQACLL